MRRLLEIFNKNKKQTFLALDIGRESVKALIFRPCTERVPLDLSSGRRLAQIEVLGLGCSFETSTNLSDNEELFLRTKEAVKKAQCKAPNHLSTPNSITSSAIGQAGLKGTGRIKKKISGTILGLGGEFIKSKTGYYSFKRPEPKEKIDSTELKNLIQKAEWKIFEEIKSSIRKDYFSKESEIKLVDTELSEILIDGCRVENPLDFSGKVVTLKIFNSFCDKSYFKTLERIPRALNLEHLVLTSTSYAVTKMLLAEKQDFKAILIDIGGNNTEVSLIKDRALVGNFTFNIGGQGFTECISRALGVGFAEAEQIKLNFSLKEVSSSVRENIRKILKRGFKIWTAGVGLGLEQFSSVGLLPGQILLYGGGSLLFGIQKTLGTTEWREALAFAKTPVVKIIYPKDVKGIQDLLVQASTPQDIPVLALGTYFSQKQKEKNYLSKILYQAVRVVER